MHKEALFETDKDGVSPLGGLASAMSPDGKSSATTPTPAAGGATPATTAAAAAAAKKEKEKPKKIAAAKKGSFGQNALSAVKRYTI